MRPNEIADVSEIVFLVEDAPEGGYIARAISASIFTEGDTLDEIRTNVRDAVECHFAGDNPPAIIRLHIVHDEILAP